MISCGKSAMIFRRNRKITNCNEFRLGIQPQLAIHAVVPSFLYSVLFFVRLSNPLFETLNLR